MACEGLITADILFDCNNPSVGGLETDVLLINAEDINIATTTVSLTNKILMTNLALKAGKSGFLLQGVKQINGTSFELVKKEFGPDKFKHMFSGVILNPSALNKLQATFLSEGGKYVVVVEQKWKGASNADAFQVYGLKSGLELMTMLSNSKENDGTISFTLESTEGYEEPTVPLTLLETDYATTKTAFNAKFLGT
jgi:hypothetical protein